MAHESICPTCATVLGPLHEARLRRCIACNRQNPHQFDYCGFCASPLEATKPRADLADVAAPEGGWPSLTAEFVQLRFFLEQGEIEDAFELFSILRQRHPGHPALTEFARRAEPCKSDDEVGAIVDSLLANSPALSGKMLRRAAPKWEAAQVEGSGRTSVHPCVREEPRRAAVVREPTRVFAAAQPPPEASPADRLTADSRSGLTVVVDALQPPTPFGEEVAVVASALQADAAPQERVRRRRAVAGKRVARKKRRKEPTSRKPRSSGGAFGAHVLDRLGKA